MKTGPGRKTNSDVARGVEERAGDVGGEQVGRALETPEVEPGRLRDAARGEGLAEAGDVFEEDVAAGEDAGERELERLAHADDELADLVEHSPAESGDLGDGEGCGGESRGHVCLSVGGPSASMAFSRRVEGDEVEIRTARGTRSVRTTPGAQDLLDLGVGRPDRRDRGRRERAVDAGPPRGPSRRCGLGRRRASSSTS